MKKGRVLYIGKSLNSDNSVSYIYQELNEDNSLGAKWSFRKSLFKKGSIGSVYDCEFEGETISYKRSEIPQSFVEEKGVLKSTFVKYPTLQKSKEVTRQIDIKLRNAKKQKSLLDIEVEQIKKVYKSLSASQRTKFIGDLIYKITK